MLHHLANCVLSYSSALILVNVTIITNLRLLGIEDTPK